MKKVIWPQNELIFRGRMAQVEALGGAQVLATVTLPWVDPESIHVIGSHFAQGPAPGWGNGSRSIV